MKNFFYVLLLFLSIGCTFRQGLGDYFHKDAIYVSLEGSDLNDGNLYTPVRTITKGISLMREKGYRRVKVTKGLFKPGDGFAYDLIEGLLIDFTAEGGFTLEGGWSLGFKEKSDLIAESDFTILDGNNLLNTILTIRDTSNIIIEGFLIRNKKMDTFNKGGGITVSNADKIRITGTLITKVINSSCIYILNSNDIVVDRARFVNNLATYGGAGMYIDNSQNIAVTDSYFENNSISMYDHGGAIYITNCNSIRISENLFVINKASNFGGALCLYQSNNAKLNKNLFRGNRGYSGGGAVYLYKANYVEIKESYFESNISPGSAIYGGGGGLKLTDSNSITIQKVYFKDNSTGFNGGALHSENSLSLHILDSEFAGNSSNNEGGAISLTMSGDDMIDLKGNDFSANSAAATNSTISINNNGLVNNFNLNIKGNNFIGPGLGTNSIALSERPYDIVGHTLKSNSFQISSFDNYYDDNGTLTKSHTLLNTPLLPDHDAETAEGNVEFP